MEKYSSLKTKYEALITSRSEYDTKINDEVKLREFDKLGSFKKSRLRYDLKERPPVSFDTLDMNVCLRHKGVDHFWLSQKREWIKKFENRYYHVSRDCLILRKSLVGQRHRCLFSAELTQTSVTIGVRKH